MNALKICLIGLVVMSTTTTLQASVTSRIVREAAEFAAKKFGKEVAEEGLEKFTAKMASLAAKHGDAVVSAAFRKVGPKAGKLVAEAGEHAGTALKLLARYGDEGASVVMRPSSLKLAARFGDDGAEALLRHGAVGEQVIGEFAERGAKALTQITPQNGRRLAMLASDGLTKPELLDVVCRYGDRACEFAWRNRGALAISSAMVAFVANPEPFLEGTTQLTGIIADSAIRPLAEEAGRHYGGTILIIGIVLVVLTFVVLHAFSRRQNLFWLGAKWLSGRIGKYWPTRTPKV